MQRPWEPFRWRLHTPGHYRCSPLQASTVVDVLGNDVVTRAALHALLVRNRLRPTEAAVFILGHGDCCGTRRQDTAGRKHSAYPTVPLETFTWMRSRELLLAVPLCTNLVVELCRVPPATQAQPDGQAAVPEISAAGPSRKLSK